MKPLRARVFQYVLPDGTKRSYEIVTCPGNCDGWATFERLANGTARLNEHGGPNPRHPCTASGRIVEVTLSGQRPMDARLLDIAVAQIVWLAIERRQCRSDTEVEVVRYARKTFGADPETCDRLCMEVRRQYYEAGAGYNGYFQDRTNIRVPDLVPWVCDYCGQTLTVRDVEISYGGTPVVAMCSRCREAQR